MISVIDYGAGNLRSVENALKELGVDFSITSDSADVTNASAILLPGVGHFGQMMRSLNHLGLVNPLREAILSGVPYLGICLGMHALFEASDEAPELEGLKIFPGRICRFPEGLKVPHMGWNSLELQPASRLFQGIAPASYVYFAHSYYLPHNSADTSEADLTAAEADYGQKFVAAIEDKNIFGVQFHPEKSGEIGLQILRNFTQDR
jgi:glutamine amidotransferase